MRSGDEASLRREFRAWARAHHPDTGGDPGEFAAGLRRWRDRLTPGAQPAPDVTAFRTRGLWRARRWWQRRHQAPRVR